MLWLGITIAVCILLLIGGGIWFAVSRQRNSRWYYNKAIDCYESENWDKALEFLSQAYELESDYSPIPYNIGVVFLNLGDLEQAKAFFEATIELDDSDVSAYYNLGFIYYEEGDFERALNSWQQAEYHSEEEDPELFFCLGLAYQATEQLEIASAVLFKSLSLAPKHQQARLTLAKVLAETDRLDEAIEQLELLLKETPNNVEANYEMALCLLKKAHWETAIVFCNKVIQMEPDNAQAFNQLGLAYYCLDKPREAIPQFQQALTLDTNYATAYNNLGYALEKLGYTEKAIEAFKAYVDRETNPNDIAETQQNIHYLEDRLAHARKQQAPSEKPATEPPQPAEEQAHKEQGQAASLSLNLPVAPANEDSLDAEADEGEKVTVSDLPVAPDFTLPTDK